MLIGTRKGKNERELGKVCMYVHAHTHMIFPTSILHRLNRICLLFSPVFGFEHIKTIYQLLVRMLTIILNLLRFVHHTCREGNGNGLNKVNRQQKIIDRFKYLKQYGLFFLLLNKLFKQENICSKSIRTTLSLKNYIANSIIPSSFHPPSIRV